MTDTNHFSIEFVQEGRVPVLEGQSLLEASQIAGIPLLHACGGHARCSTCRVLILEGGDSLTPPKEHEKQLGDQMCFPPNVRLACQIRVQGNTAKVTAILRDQSDISLYVGQAAGEATQHMGVEKELVLFFLDIRNFTHFVETHLAFDVIHIIRKLFTMFQTVIDRHNGKVIEIAGDGMYAVFGLNQNLSQSASSAVQAGYTILTELKQFNEYYFVNYFNRTISIGIGVHQGEAIIGTILLGDENHLIVMGYPVNVASRLQNATKELNNDFIVSSAIIDLLPNRPACSESTSIYLRGVPNPLSVYLLGEPYTKGGSLPVTS